MLLKLIDITFKVQNKNILSKLNIKIDSEKHVLLIGPSGCGKTTLINLMAGLLKPTSGEIIFENKKYSSLSELEIDNIRAENFGYIFQRHHLIDHLSVEQNILLAKKKTNSQEINKLINNLGLKSKQKQIASSLSFGEAQRLAIARGVVNNPKLIFADEPTSALDNNNTKKVIDLIFSQAKKTQATLVVSTHDERLKKYFSNIKKIPA